MTMSLGEGKWSLGHPPAGTRNDRNLLFPVETEGRGLRTIGVGGPPPKPGKMVMGSATRQTTDLD